jgi:tRNA threonylcarbamoyladenosine biosynthesis protein TsaB
MSVILAIETSSANYGIAVCTRRELISHLTVRRDSASFPGIGRLVSATLSSVDATFKDIEHIAVGIGPGNLSSVRTGIAYANGLAFSLGKMIFCANSLELLALEVAHLTSDAVLCLRNAGGGNVYAGLFRDGSTLGLQHGPMEEVVTTLCRSHPEVSVAGAFRREMSGILTHACVKNTGVEAPNVRTLHKFLARNENWAADLVPMASPITESSEVFHV